MNILIILFLFVSFFALFWLLKFYFDKKFLVSQFKRNNVLVFGAKGTGKDLVFQAVINKRKKEKYLSNINYGGSYSALDLKDISLGDNTFDNFILGMVSPIKKINEWENQDIYFSDLGIYLPSHYDSMLTKNYKSLPISMALQRHLYNSNFHGNSQSIKRTWLKFRELGDGYVRVRGSKKLLGFLPYLVTECYYYSEYESAEKMLLPMATRGLKNDYNRALIEQHKATYGEIKKLYIVNKIKNIKYDTRYFHKVVFNETYKEWQKKTDLKAKELNKNFASRFKYSKNKKNKKK